MQLVTGHWSLFHDYTDSDFIPPFSSRADMTPFFLENSLIVISVLIPATVLFVVVKAYHQLKTS